MTTTTLRYWQDVRFGDVLAKTHPTMPAKEFSRATVGLTAALSALTALHLHRSLWIGRLACHSSRLRYTIFDGPVELDHRLDYADVMALCGLALLEPIAHRPTPQSYSAVDEAYGISAGGERLFAADRDEVLTTCEQLRDARRGFAKRWVDAQARHDQHGARLAQARKDVEIFGIHAAALLAKLDDLGQAPPSLEALIPEAHRLREELAAVTAAIGRQP